jgi:hypothetical protein
MKSVALCIVCLWSAPQAGGKPDLSASLFPPEFTDIAARLKDGLPYHRAWSRSCSKNTTSSGKS